MRNKTEKFNDTDTLWMASEPIGQYGVAENAFGIVNARQAPKAVNTRPGELGFYTTDPLALQERIGEIEKSVEIAEQGDESDWLTSDEFDMELKQEFGWLQ